jgi:hypothetical protein
MIVTTAGFTQPAINYTRERNIALATMNYEATSDDYALVFMGHPLILLISRNACTVIKQNEKTLEGKTYELQS